MKRIPHITLTAAFGLLIAGQAAADAPTAELKVAGKITVPGCAVAVAGQGGANTGEYNFGSIDRSNIQAGTATKTLAPLTKTWIVTCDGKTNLTYQITDNKLGSSSSPLTSSFGLGNVNGTGKIGYYEVDMLNAKVGASGANPVAVQVFATASGTFSRAGTVKLDRTLKMGWSDNGSNVLAVGDTFIADFKVTPTLAGTQTMGGVLADDIQLDGSLTFSFAFGL